MGLDFIVQNAQLFLLIFVRVLAIVELAPLVSSGGVPQIAKIGLSFFTAVAVFPAVAKAGYPIPDAALEYGLLVVGEALVGILISFMLMIIYSAFTAAGEFFSVQMGFGASEVFDALAQVEIPLVGQFVNVMAMFVFLSVDGFQRLFLTGVQQGFQTTRAIDFVLHRGDIFPMVLGSLGILFKTALIISLPVLGTLLLVSVAMGLLAKAAPQMNLLMMGFPISITIAFVVMFLAMPYLINTFALIIEKSFESIQQLFILAQGARS